MENKINMAELLKDCPQGMELDCILYDNIYFDIVEHNSIKCYIQNKGYRTSVTFDVYGGLIDSIPTKCVIFPKGKTTWVGFQRPFKDGDIIFVTNNESDEGFHYKYIAIFKEIKRDKDIYVYGLYSYNEDVFSLHPYLCEITNSTIIKLATEEEKQKLFDAIKANGYKWNPETKTLEKLNVPIFKVGDKIRYKGGNRVKRRIVKINNREEFYYTDDGGRVYFMHQDDWELVPDKFDITTLKPFDKVLVRDHNAQEWVASLFSNYNEPKKYKYICVNGSGYAQCIPYEGNEHLLGKKDDCNKYFKTWK